LQMNTISAGEKYLVAITGASGMIFLQPFLKLLEAQGIQVHGICSDAGRSVLDFEVGLTPEKLPGISRWFDIKDFSAPPSSGSSGYAGMVVLPCSMGTLAAIANGLSLNLIHRAADVLLKERKTLVLGIRETPFNRTHLQNMLQAHDAGAIICPPMPGYYLKPATLLEAAETFAWRLADQIGLKVAVRKSWGDAIS
jgi:4-hydroxy-3-polyprenylbenzoate decarboxylase